ncbi:hypothetical protein Tco_1014897 [Tanacetum coccineum]
MTRSGEDLKMAKLLFGIKRHVIENKVETLTITTFLFPSKKVLRAAISSEMKDVLHPFYHPTSNMEDAFSSNFPNYLPPASPNYIPTSPGKTYSSSSNSFGIIPLALLTLSLFHDDPYMKALQECLPKGRQLVVDSVSAALEAQAANMENTDNTTRPREAQVARHCSYKEFMSCQPINFKETFDKEVLSSRTEIQKMEDEFYHLTVKGNDLKTYVRRFQELATLCPTMVPDFEKMMEVFIGELPRSIEGNVTASKPQTLEEAINIAQRQMDQVTKHTPMQVLSDHE